MEPAGPTSCMKCGASMAWTKPLTASHFVHKRVQEGAISQDQCNFCTDGLTLVAATCEKTGVCSTIGPVPYYKASGDCLPCPAEEDVGSAGQLVVVALLLLVGTGGIWLSSKPPVDVAVASVVPDSSASKGSSKSDDHEIKAGQGAEVGADSGVSTSAGTGAMVESALILLPTFQLIATALSFDASWPNYLRDLGSWLKTLLVGNFSQVASPECVFSYGQFKDDDRYNAVLFFKFGVFVLVALVFGGIAATGIAGLHTHGPHAISALAAAYSIFLVLISTACFEAINVKELPNGSYALASLPSITSETDDFVAVLMYGIIGLLLFLIIIPTFLIWALWSARAKMQLWAPTTQAQFGTLFLRYRPGCWWYEFAFMARKIALTAIAILSGNAVAACVLSIVVLCTALALHVRFKPYNIAGGHETVAKGDDKHEHCDEAAGESSFATPDKLEVICMGSLFAIYVLGILCIGLEPAEGSGSATAMSLVAVAVMLLPLGAAVHLNKKDGHSYGMLIKQAMPDLSVLVKSKDSSSSKNYRVYAIGAEDTGEVAPTATSEGP